MNLWTACHSTSDNRVIDDPKLAALLPHVRHTVFTYSLAAEAAFRLEVLPSTNGGQSQFLVHRKGDALGPFMLSVPSLHSLRNATAAVAIGTQLGVSVEKIAAGLAEFSGVERRLQRKGEVHGVTVVDDYRHHPTEIRATFEAARQCGFRRILVLFQPHRYTRTRDLIQEFRDCFRLRMSSAFSTFMLQQTPILGVDALALVEVIDGADVCYSYSNWRRSVSNHADPS